MDGVINVFKEQGMTSFDVVFHCKRIFETRKVGHTGTLDPMATGVLPICINKGTKLVEYLTAEDKVYTTTLKLGIATDTQDVTGTVCKASDKKVTEAEVKAAAYAFLGESMQLPPMYSAIKINGEKLVDLARRGVVIDRAPRPIAVYSIDFLRCDEENGEYEMRVHCKKGTYIRTLCHDIGEKLGTGGVMKTLNRNKSGNFEETTALTLDQLKKAKQDGCLSSYLLPLDYPFAQYEKLVVDEKQEELIKNGMSLALSRLQVKDDETPVAVYNGEDKFIMIAQKQFEEDSLKQLKSFW